MAKARTKAARALAKKQGKKSVGKAKPSATKKSAVRSRHSTLCTAPCAPTLRLLMSIPNFVCCSQDKKPPVEEPPVEAEPPVEEEPEVCVPRTARPLRVVPDLASQPCECCCRSQAPCAVVSRFLHCRLQDQGPVLLRDAQAYGPLRADPGQPDQDLDRYTFATVVKSEKAYRVCWGLWDADALLWRNMRGAAVQPNSEWLRVKDVSEGGRYQRAPAGTHTEARFTTLWRPVVEGL